MANKFNSALGVIGSFVAANPKLEASKIEYTVQAVLRYLRSAKMEVTLENMNLAYDRLAEAAKAMSEPEVEEPEDAELEKFVAQINSWSADAMRENMKNPEVAEAVERVLAAKAKQKPKAKAVPKPQPKPAAPVKDPLEVAINKMSASEMKRALSDPARARGIENILRRNQ